MYVIWSMMSRLLKYRTILPSEELFLKTLKFNTIVKPRKIDAISISKAKVFFALDESTDFWNATKGLNNLVMYHIGHTHVTIMVSSVVLILLVPCIIKLKSNYVRLQCQKKPCLWLRKQIINIHMLIHIYNLIEKKINVLC